MKNLFIYGLLICLCSACLEKTDVNKLSNSNWELTELTGAVLPETAKATLNIGDSLMVTGKSFCNSYGGKAEIIDNKLAFKNIFGTKMFCQEYNAAETAYLKALNQVNGAKINEDKLLLLNGNKILLVYKKTK